MAGVRCARGRKAAFVGAAGGATDTVLVPAVSGQRIRVVGFIISPPAATPAASVVFNSKGTGAGTAVSATFGCVAGVAIIVPDAGPQSGLFETNAGEGLSVTTGAGASGAGVHVIYEEIGS